MGDLIDKIKEAGHEIDKLYGDSAYCDFEEIAKRESGRDEPSHVLMALGLTEQQAKSAIRISYGRYNNTDEVETIVTNICYAYKKILAAKS